MKRKHKRILAAVMIITALFLGARCIVRPMEVKAAAAHKSSKRSRKKRSRRYFTRTGFEWDNHYLQAGKKEDLSKYVKGTAGLSKKARAKLIRWRSSKPLVVSVNRYGIAKAKKAGKARIRCRMKTRRGWKTVTKTIRVFDSRKVAFSVSLSLTEGNRYVGKVKNSYNVVFDTVTVRIRNKSSKPVTLKKDLLVCGPECSYVKAKDRYGVDVWMHRDKASSQTIPPGKTQTVVYRTEGALSYVNEDLRNYNTSLILSFSSDGAKKELRYEMPKGKITINR